MSHALDAQTDKNIKWREMPSGEFTTWFHKRTHCSAIFKLAPDNSELFHGHCTWIFWPWASRIYKTITLNSSLASNKAKTISFSSWAGAMSSFDDFYVTSAGLSILETSICVFNEQLWIDAKEFSKNNGGTYNNEWYVLDRKLFTPGQAPPAGTLTVVNQMPTTIAHQDMTPTLVDQKYVPSYNVPVIDSIANLAGYPEAIRQRGGDSLSYEDCARAKIFRRDHHNVTDISTLKFLIQYNDYENDELSQKNPFNAIASRGDKLKKDAMAFGAIDAKVTSVSEANAGVVHAFSGPTPQQGPWSFDTPGVNVGPYDGLPVKSDFKWVAFSCTPTAGRGRCCGASGEASRTQASGAGVGGCGRRQSDSMLQRAQVALGLSPASQIGQSSG